MHKPSFGLLLLSITALTPLGCSSPSPSADDAASQSDGGTADGSRADVGPLPDTGLAPDGGPPPDAFVPVDAPLSNGATCDAASDCASGECVDGLCCARACDGVCQACAEALTGQPDGTCAPVMPSDPEDECDAADCLTGSCGASGCELQSAGFECRAVAGTCDVAETCTGVDAACPPDAFESASTVCRASSSVCDLEESCSGSSADCPNDAFAPYGTVCRGTAGVCDVTEVCSGGDGVCPSDAFLPASSPLCGAYDCSGATCLTACTAQSDCSTGNVCVASACVPAYRIFVTAQWFAPNFGGATGADALCVSAAVAAGLGPNYRAWISDASTSASLRLYHSTIPYYRMDGTTPRIIASSWSDLVDGIAVAIATDELGMPHRDEASWTGTTDNGTGTGANCANWTSASGSLTGTSGNSSAAAFSTYYGQQSCSRSQHLYCVEQPPAG